MLTYTSRRNLYGKLTNDSSTENLDMGDFLLEQAEREIASMKPWRFLDKQFSISTVASQQFYNLDQTIDEVNSVNVLVSTFRITPKQAPTLEAWDQINSTTVTTSDYPEWYFVYNGQVGFWPIPSTTQANAITVNARRRPVTLNKADYITGSIVSVSNGGVAVVGTGTTWTAQMAGSSIQITASNTANKGDGVWYPVLSVQSATELTLGRAYEGTVIAAGTAAYILGQVSSLPEAYDVLPVYKACQQYFQSIQPIPSESDRFEKQYDKGIAMLKASYGQRTSDVLIESSQFWVPENPNNAPTF